MNWLKTFMLVVDKTNIWVGKMLVVINAAAITVITFEVVMRYFFGKPTNWGHETMTLMFAVVYVMAGGFAHYYRAHVRVDVIYSLMSERGKAVLDCITGLLFFIFVGSLVWTSWNFYWSSQMMDAGGTLFGFTVLGENSLTDWAPPLYPVKFMLFLGSFLLMLQGLVWFIRDAYLAFSGRKLQ